MTGALRIIPGICVTILVFFVARESCHLMNLPSDLTFAVGFLGGGVLLAFLLTAAPRYLAWVKRGRWSAKDNKAPSKGENNAQ